MSDLRGLPHVYMFVCVPRVDADVGGVIAAADITQLSQRHTRCSRLNGRSRVCQKGERAFFKKINK